jgi:hypothetical protein
MFAEFVRACDKELKLILTFTKYYPRAQEEDEAKVEFWIQKQMVSRYGLN